MSIEIASSAPRGRARAVTATAALLLGSLVAFAASAPQLTRTDVAAGLEPNGMVIADFDGDGDLDLATIDRTIKIVKIRRNSGDGVTYSNESVSLVAPPDDLAFGKFDGNAFPDLVAVGGGDFEVILNAGPGGDSRLQLTLKPPVGDASFAYTSVATIDVEKDGDDDIAVAFDDPAQNGVKLGGYIDVYRCDGAGAHALDSTLDVGSNASDMASGDLNGDGYADLVATSSTDRGLYYFSNKANGSTTLNDAEFDLGTNVPMRIAIGDVTGDGKPDVIAGGWQNRGTYLTGSIEVFRNLGGANHESGQPSGRFWHEYGLTFLSQLTPIPASPLGPDVAVADMNADGKLDVLVACGETDQFFVQTFRPVTGAGGAFVSLDPDGLSAYDAPDKGSSVVAGKIDSGASVDAVVLGLAGTMAVFKGPAGGGGGGTTVDPPPGAPPATTTFVVKAPKIRQDGQKWKFTATQTAPFVTGVRIQSSATPNDAASWRDLPVGARMTGNGRGSWKATATDITDLNGTNSLSFRTVSTAPGRPETPSDPSVAFVVEPRAPKIEIELSAVTSSDATGLTVSAGEGFIYTLKVKNVGSAQLENARLDAYIPKPMTFVTGTEPFSVVGRSVDPFYGVQFNLGTLLPGASLERAFVTSLPETASASSIVTLGAQIRVGKVTAQSNGLVTSLRGALSLQIEPKRTSIGAGEVLGYTLTVRNNSSDTVADVVVTDPIPELARVEAAWFLDAVGAITGSPVPNPNGGFNPQVVLSPKIPKSVKPRFPMAQWFVGPMAPRTQKQLLIELRMPYDLPATGSIGNGGYNATGTLPSGKVVTAFRTTSPSVSVPFANRIAARSPQFEVLQFAFTDRGASFENDGTAVPLALHDEDIAYAVAYRNKGTADAEAVSLRGTFPPGTDYVPGSFVLDGTPITGDPRLLITPDTWTLTLGSLDDGSSGVLAFVARVRKEGTPGAPKAGSAVVATAALYARDFNSPVHAEPETLAVVIPKAVDFRIATGHDLRSRAAVGETHRYLHTVYNSGGVGAASVLATGQIPGMTCVGATVGGSPATFTQTGDRVVINLGNVAAKAKVSFTLDCRLDVAPPPGRQVVHVMRVNGVAQGSKAKVKAEAVSSDVMDCDGPACSTVFVGSIVPYLAYTGAEYTCTVFWGNATDVTARDVVVRAQISSATRVPAGGIDDGGKQKGDVIEWRVGDVPGHWGGAVTFRLVADTDSSTGGFCFVTQRAWVTSSNAPSKGTGIVPTNIRSGNPYHFLLQTGACTLGGLGTAIQGGGNLALDTALSIFTFDSQSVRVGGADLFTTANGVVTIQLLGGRAIAMGPSGRIDSANPAVFQRPTTGVNVFMLGDAANIQVNGIVCTGSVSLADVLDRKLEIVACNEANVFSTGGGNTVNATGTGLLSNAASGLVALTNRIELEAKLIKSPGGGLVAAGGGNVVPTGAAGLIGLDGASLVGQDGSTLIGLDGATLVAAGGGNLVGNDGASLVGQDGSTLIGLDGASKR